MFRFLKIISSDCWMLMHQEQKRTQFGTLSLAIYPIIRLVAVRMTATPPR